MKLDIGFNPNCSEAVFRFHTDKPEIAHKILQAFADEVAEANEHPAEIIPSLSKIEDVEEVSFGACAGLGEPVSKCAWEPKKRAFVLCIGNNDILPEGEACQVVRKLGVKVEEAETCPSLAAYARDCTCGIVFFPETVKKTGAVP